MIIPLARGEKIELSIEAISFQVTYRPVSAFLHAAFHEHLGFSDKQYKFLS